MGKGNDQIAIAQSDGVKVEAIAMTAYYAAIAQNDEVRVLLKSRGMIVPMRRSVPFASVCCQILPGRVSNRINPCLNCVVARSINQVLAALTILLIANRIDRHLASRPEKRLISPQ
jgi:hypothetical protein